MQTRFLLGPAGSGKTYSCLAEIRAELERSPEGPPLVLLAPKQATFQLERQLLADPSIAGYTRLHILSFERLAEFVLNHTGHVSGEFLSEEGRLMVLRALLARKRDDLQIFRSSARLPGFVRHLHLVLREMQRHCIGPRRLRELAVRVGSGSALDRKLRELAVLLEAYVDWLSRHKLQDADSLLDVAAEVLRSAWVSSGAGTGFIGGLWLDGFAEMTPQEMEFLATVVPRCDRATLAFCLEAEPVGDAEQVRRDWLSTWSVVAQTYRGCRSRIGAQQGVEVEVEVISRVRGKSRFGASPGLAELEAAWARPWNAPPGEPATGAELRMVCCANPEAEAVEAAREILDFVQAGGRYRQTAVLLRSLVGYDDAVRRVFRRYDIPFFLDQREPVAHHPLAELTRFALRTVAFDWRHDDWFGALKTGLVSNDEASLDWLENEALARGWAGDTWLRPFEFEGGDAELTSLERFRREIIAPFEDLRVTVMHNGFRLTGPQLASAVRELWARLEVEVRLEQWSDEVGGDPREAAIHTTVWEQVNDWLDNVTRAFAEETLPLVDWLPVLEAGLGGLTVGIIPPALDQVLVGAIDRSRNPDLDLALVLGVNESVFPVPPSGGGLLSEEDRAALEDNGVELGLNLRRQIGRERYYGYIACTRARRRLVLTCAQRNGHDAPLNPSPFFDHLCRIMPGARLEKVAGPPDARAARHVQDLIESGVLTAGAFPGLDSIAEVMAVREQLKGFRTIDSGEALSSVVADRLYGPILKTSVSSIERFAACPFQFFVSHGLGAQERKAFELEARERGDFQHAVLAAFHEWLKREGRRWRDLDPTEAAELIGQIATEVARDFKGGLMTASAGSRFQTAMLTEALQKFVAVQIGWLSRYQFDPTAVELGFGVKGALLPAWEIDLGEGRRLAFRGRTDRLDLFRLEDGRALAVVIDYKSGGKEFEPLLAANGLQLQLPSYLGALRQIGEAATLLGVRELVPAGAFYFSLRGHFESAPVRSDVVENCLESEKRAYQPSGRFDFDHLKLFDNASGQPGGPFQYALKADGQPKARGSDAILSKEFADLIGSAELQLGQMGRRIFEGEVAVDPYERSGQRACDWCDYREVCRIDPWRHVFRGLMPVVKKDGREK